VQGKITKREGPKLTIQIVTATPVVRADETILWTASEIVPDLYAHHQGQ
jgi:hypothetical protein